MYVHLHGQEGSVGDSVGWFGARRHTLWLAIAILLTLGVALVLDPREAWAATRTVPTSPGCDTIQDCVNTSDDGDTVLIKPGEYRENVIVDKDLTITGAAGNKCKAPQRVIVDGTLAPDTSGDVFTVTADGVTIRCLKVRNADDGIFADGVVGGDDLSLNNLIVEATADDNIAVTGDGLRLERSQLLASGDSALDLDGADGRIVGVTARGHNGGCIDIAGDNNRVEGSRMERCEDAPGIFIDGNDGQAIDNTTTSTDGAGVDIEGDDGRAVDNTITSTNAAGVDIDGAAPRATGNNTSTTELDGFLVDCTARCDEGLIQRNTATLTNNDDDGFDIDAEEPGEEGLRILNNTARGNIQNGFLLAISGAIVRGNTAEANGSETEHGFDITGAGNTIEANRSNRNNADGFNIDGDANVLTGNTAEANSEDGIDIESGTDNRLIGNTATGNQAEGIENNALLTDVIDNRSNRNRIDCANDGTIDENSGNRCADGSDFNVPPEVDN